MESITQITNLLDGYKMAKIDIIDNHDSTSRYTEFYRMLKSGAFKSDEDAAKHFYPEQEGRDVNYRKLKSQYLERLMNAVLFLDIHNKKASEHQNAVAEAEKLWVVIIVLYNRGAFIAALEESEKLLKHCIYYELTELIVQITDKLKHMHGTITGDSQRYAYMKKLHLEYVDHYLAELKAKDLFQSIRMPYVKSAAYNKEMYAVADKATRELEPLLPNCSTYMFMTFWYCINLSKYQTIFDHKNVLKVCEEGIEHFKQKKYVAAAPLMVLMNQKLICQIQLRSYEESKVTAQEVLKLHVEGTHNWYKTLEQRMMLAFHTRQYAEAYDVYQMAVKHRDFKFLKGGNLEIWFLYEANLYFLLKMGKIQGLCLEQSILKNFKLIKFVNNMSQFSGDKKGMNVPALIIQYVLQLTEKKREQLADRIEAMEQYVKRYVKTDEAFYRCHYFLKLLLELSKVNYSKKLIAAKAKTLLKDMEASATDIMAQGDRIEILPFEYLWEEILPLLHA
jgi:hypothetical protein